MSRALPSGRATRPSDQAPLRGLGDTASIPSAFTPGPWNCGRQRKVYAGVETPVAQSIAVNGHYPEAIANARLIAGAPALYAALETAAEVLEAISAQWVLGEPLNEMLYAAHDDAMAALAKARGEA